MDSTFRNVMCFVFPERNHPWHLPKYSKGTVLAEEATSKYLGVDLQHSLCKQSHQNKQTACSHFYIVTYYNPAKKQRRRLTCQCFDKTSTTAAPSGTLTKETTNTNISWYDWLRTAWFVTGGYWNTTSMKVFWTTLNGRHMH